MCLSASDRCDCIKLSSALESRFGPLVVAVDFTGVANETRPGVEVVREGVCVSANFVGVRTGIPLALGVPAAVDEGRRSAISCLVSALVDLVMLPRLFTGVSIA